MGGRALEGGVGQGRKLTLPESWRGKRQLRRRHEEGKRDIKQSVSKRDRDCAHCVRNNASHTAKRLALQPQATMTITIWKGWKSMQWKEALKGGDRPTLWPPGRALLQADRSLFASCPETSRVSQLHYPLATFGVILLKTTQSYTFHH